ncbi:MAG: hypothetical protein ACRC7O_18225 [Fimbriiglobus sp.]
MIAGWCRTFAAVAVLAAGVGPAHAAETAPLPRATASDPESTRQRAEAAERAGHWDAALEAYVSLYLAAPAADIRDRVRACLRNSAQVRRHRDPAFQQFVLNLTPADALAVYADAVGKLATLYVDRDRATPGKLFA